MYVVRYEGHKYIYLDLSEAIEDAKIHNGTFEILIY